MCNQTTEIIYKMRLHITLLFVILISYSGLANNYQDFTDNEFAEFEEFESEDELVVDEPQSKESAKESSQDTEDVFVSDDDDEADIMIEDDSEFEHFQDTEEFEGFADNKDEKLDAEPKITITTVPIHFRANWDSYWLEILMIAGLVVYFVNFATGKSKNTKIANAWFQTHRTLLEDNFFVVGKLIIYLKLCACIV